MRGPSDLCAKRTSENLNILCVSYFASQRSFLRKTNEQTNPTHPFLGGIKLHLAEMSERYKAFCAA